MPLNDSINDKEQTTVVAIAVDGARLYFALWQFKLETAVDR